MGYVAKKYSKRKVHYGNNSGCKHTHPVIRISGNYLSKLGFEIGSLIEVEIEPNQIFIRRIEKEKET
jgi:hypothetical protein